MILGIDTATPITADKAKSIKEAGYDFAGRYLVPTTMWKALTRAEAQALTAAGLRILTVWETTADRVKGGANAGAADGASALKCAHEIGMPSSGVIYFAVDFGASEADMDAIEAYLRAARANTEEYEVGVYGSYSVVEAMAQRGACTHFWQCVGWSYGKKSPHRNVYQAKWGMSVAGVAIDVNECDDMDAAGIWNYEEDTGSLQRGLHSGYLHPRNRRYAEGGGKTSGRFDLSGDIIEMQYSKSRGNAGQKRRFLKKFRFGSGLGQSKKEQRKNSPKAIKNPLKSTDFSGFLVRVAGFEPTASWSRTKHATNCATPG